MVSFHTTKEAIVMPEITTRFLILSDTHGEEFRQVATPLPPADVAIHCGDLTEESKIAEFRVSLRLLMEINAPLKLVIAGNHDFTMDVPQFRRKARDANPPLDPDLVKKEYGDFGEARKLFTEALADGIVFLDEGTHQFPLENGALLRVYASPFTPSAGDWGFQFRRSQGHDFSIDKNTDVVITHGPPRGVLDITDSGQHAGCRDLFAAVARSRPRLHCFGHIHEAWGAKLVTWRENIADAPSHFSDIDHGRSTVVESLLSLRGSKWDTPEEAADKARRLESHIAQGFRATSHCTADEAPLKPGLQTLFVNAAIQGIEENRKQMPWLVDIELPARST